MSLERKIREMDTGLIYGSDDFHQGFKVGKHKAATLAAEADEFMREMADVLSKVAVEQEGTHAGLDADFALTKYFMFQENNQ